MTREEAIEELEILKENYWDDDGYGHETKQYDDTMLALEMAIKALKQQSAIDKIRAEIMDFEEELFHIPNTDYADYAAVRHCVEIIDKYKESEK